MAMQRLQHETVATESDKYIGLVGLVLAVRVEQRAEGTLGFIGGTGEEGEAGRRHGGEHNALAATGAPPRSMPTNQAREASCESRCTATEAVG